MAQPALKSIHPVNLLSFGPKTEPMELRQLNIVLGANGSGKSNLIEVIRLLHFLPDKDPWSAVLAAGGASEWVWKSQGQKSSGCSLRAKISFGKGDREIGNAPDNCIDFAIELESFASTFRIQRETIGTCSDAVLDRSFFNHFERSGSQGRVRLRDGLQDRRPIPFDLNLDSSIFAQLASPAVQTSGLVGNLPEIFQISEFFESFDFHQDWEFGADSSPRDPVPVGQPVGKLDEYGHNLAQMLAYFRDEHKLLFERVKDLTRKFYEPTKNIEVRLLSTHLQIFIEEQGGFSTPATRLSDGMLRWLALLCILLNPSPPPVTCIDEPELGFHPDIIPTLADLLGDASTRTQLIVTTHSSALVDAFSDDPESICVCEKVEGSTSIRRLSKPDLNVWLKDYSLGNLWTSGEIGGNRW